MLPGCLNFSGSERLITSGTCGCLQTWRCASGGSGYRMFFFMAERLLPFQSPEFLIADFAKFYAKPVFSAGRISCFGVFLMFFGGGKNGLAYYFFANLACDYFQTICSTGGSSRFGFGDVRGGKKDIFTDFAIVLAFSVNIAIVCFVIGNLFTATTTCLAGVQFAGVGIIMAWSRYFSGKGMTARTSRGASAIRRTGCRSNRFYIRVLIHQGFVAL